MRTDPSEVKVDDEELHVGLVDKCIEGRRSLVTKYAHQHWQTANCTICFL